jgi:DNA-binding NarL/FixJ family response regulator
MGSIRVVLGDDHTLVREGIRACLSSPRVCVVDEAEDGRDLVRRVQASRPDVALVDVSMPLLNGIEATRQIARVSPETRVVILSMFDDAGYIAAAQEAGAWGYVLKDEAPEHLLRTIERVVAGERSFPPVREGSPAARPSVRLTPREREVLQLVVEGKRAREIAEILHRSVHTVRNHRARLMKKLGVHAAAGLMAKAEEMGVVRFDAARRNA